MYEMLTFCAPDSRQSFSLHVEKDNFNLIGLCGDWSKSFE